MPKHKSSRHLIAVREDAKRLSQRRGVYTLVARRLGLTPAHVRNVAVGLRSSVRVEQAIAAEMLKRERKAIAAERAA